MNDVRRSFRRVWRLHYISAYSRALFALSAGTLSFRCTWIAHEIDRHEGHGSANIPAGRADFIASYRLAVLMGEAAAWKISMKLAHGVVASVFAILGLVALLDHDGGIFG